MSFRKTAVKKNVPRVDLQDYNIIIAGGYKSGKTRLWKEVTELFFPNDPDAALLLAFEDGYNTWELESVVDMHNRDWNFFKHTVVPDLVKEAEEGRITKVIGIDTVDKLFESASKWLIDKWNKKYGTDYESLQEFNANISDDNVWTALKDEIWTQIDKLKRAGYGMFWLVWTKEKETTTRDGLKYNSITYKMPKTGTDIFASQAHLICTLHNDIKILDKDGNVLEENLKNKKGKEVAALHHATEVNMYFLPSTYIDIAGGRFTELPEKVPYSAENFLKVFEDAVKGQLKKNKKDINKLKEEQAKDREENVQEFIEKEKKTKQASEIISQIDIQIERLDKKQRQAIAKPFQELFGKVLDYKTSTDIEKLQKALEITKGV